MTAVVFWAAVIAAAVWWGTRPARRTTQDRRDLRNIETARTRHHIRTIR